MNLNYLKLLFLLMAVIGSSSSYAQYNETIRADRPGEAFVPFTVGNNVLQLQAGIGYLEYSKIGFETDTNSTQIEGKSFVSSLLLRMGLTEKFEVTLGVGYTGGKVENSFLSTGENGLSALSFGLRTNIYEGHGWIPSIGFMVDFGLPWLSGEYNSSYIRPSFSILTNQRMGERFGLTTNLGLLWNGDVASPIGRYVVNVSYDISSNWGVFIEPYGYINQNTWEPHVDGGVGFLINNNLQVDASAGYGWGEQEYRDWFVSAGLSWRVRFKEKA